jgi:hypothetical protein
VSEDECLRLTGGPGSLATEEQYGDFVLQLECKAPGKGGNGGIAFRTPPNKNEPGYEARIQNDWLFGTGGIPPLLAARRQLAEENEWFTMTVVATGRHIATWVNGIQAVDWDDNRPLKENPRQGCRLEKGTISLQAHDPTTDLLFRNIRIAELSAKKTE